MTIKDWDYGFAINGQQLSDYCTNVRIVPLSASFPKGEPVELPYHDAGVEGLYRPSGAMDIPIEADLRYTDPSGAVTHIDKGPGHVFENRSELLKLFGRTDSTRWLQATFPHLGDIEVPFRVIIPPSTGTPHFRNLWFLRTLDSYWREQAQRTGVNPVPTITVAGDAPVGDGVYTFSGTNGVQRATHTDSGDYIEVNDDTTVNPVVVDLLAGTVTQLGTPVPNSATFSTPRGIWLQPGVNNMTISGGGSLAVDLYEKWR
jgi:hypothetical protein